MLANGYLVISTLVSSVYSKGAWWSSGLTRYVEAMPRIEGSKQAVSSSFSSRTYRQQTGVKKLRLQAVARRKAGAAKAGAATTFVSKVEWLREMVRFVSKTIKWLKRRARIDMERKL